MKKGKIDSLLVISKKFVDSKYRIIVNGGGGGGDTIIGYRCDPTSYTFTEKKSADSTSATFPVTGYTKYKKTDGTQYETSQTVTLTATYYKNDTTSDVTKTGTTTWNGVNVSWTLTQAGKTEPVTETFYYGKMPKSITGFNLASTALITNITGNMFSQAISSGDLSGATSNFANKTIQRNFEKFDYIIGLVPSTSSKKFYRYDIDDETDVAFTAKENKYANGEITVTINNKVYKIFGQYEGDTTASGGYHMSLH